jgi:hypothetical protein
MHAALLTRRLDEPLRLMLEDNKDEHSLKAIAACRGFGGNSPFSLAFRARFDVRGLSDIGRLTDRHAAKLRNAATSKWPRSVGRSRPDAGLLFSRPAFRREPPRKPQGQRPDVSSSDG